jgi:hypothetical protein
MEDNDNPTQAMDFGMYFQDPENRMVLHLMGQEALLIQIIEK